MNYCLLKNYILIVSFLVISITISAQEFGGFPPSYKFYQINTDTVRVIFPIGLEKQAMRIANTTHYLNRNNRLSIGNKQLKIDIVLQNQTVISNGYVALGPFKSQFYTTPMQESASLGSISWLDLLAVHEYRHVLQYMNSRKGVSKVMYWFFGQYGWAASTGLSVPNWFWEGDAVAQETALTPQGRGRVPAFFNDYRSIGLSGKVYNYPKARNGSLKDFVPDHYRLGYLMGIYGRQAYGNEFWKNVFADATSYKYLFYPFSRALVHHTPERLNTRRFYQRTINYYYKKWKNEIDTLTITSAKQLNTTSKQNTYTSYTYPQFTEDGKIVVLKASYKKIGTFYFLDKSGREKRITSQGFTTDNYFNYKNGLLTWSEISYHPRWNWYNYSVIKIYDIKKHKKRRLTFKTKYFSPSFSNDTSKIVVVESTPDMQYSLHIIDARSGILIKKMPNPENLYFTYPKWTTDDQFIISSARKQNGEMALLKINIEKGEFEQLTPFSNNILGINYPTSTFNYFEASYSGIDNIYAVRPGDSTIYQVTSRTIGNYQPSINSSGDNLIFSEFSSMGDNLFQQAVDSTTWKPIDIVPLDQQKKFDFEGIKAEGGNMLEKIGNRAYGIKKYLATNSLINIHSWQPYLVSPNYGAYIFSDNVLDNFSASAGAFYNTNEKATTYVINFIYGGFFSHINAGFNSVTNRSLSNLNHRKIWNENIITGGLKVPLNFTKSIYSTAVEFSTGFNYIMLNNVRDSILYDKTYHNNEAFGSIKAGFTFINARKKARQNIYSRFGQYLDFNFNQALSDKGINQLQSNYEFSLPGIFANHNLVLDGGFRHENYINNYKYFNNFFNPRGYSNLYAYDNVFRLGVNYHFPLIYPDFGVAGIVYFLRIRANLFFDYGFTNLSFQTISNSGESNRYYSESLYRSIGGELIFDTKLFNVFNFSFGLRSGYRSDPFKGQRKEFFDFFIPIKRL